MCCLKMYISEAIRRVDDATSHSKTVLDLFSTSLEIHRQKLRENCEKLIFTDPLLYGRKAQDLLWRKGYYETVSTAKRLRNSDTNYDDLILMHINTGIGHYHRLISKIQIEMNIDITYLIDYPIVDCNHMSNDPVKDEENLNLKNWAKSSIQMCLVYLGDLSRYKTEYEQFEDCSLSARYYLQASSIDIKNGMPFNQLGTLFSNKNYHLDSIRYYITCLCCENPFEGAEGNLLRILEKNTKYLEMYSSKENNELDHCELVKKFIYRFESLVKQWHFNDDSVDSAILNYTVFYELEECMNIRPINIYNQEKSKERVENMYQQSIAPDSLNTYILHSVVMITLLSLNKFTKVNSTLNLSLKTFAFTLFSRLLERLLSELIDVGFVVQSPKEIFEEFKRKSRYYKETVYERTEVIQPQSNVIIPENDNISETSNVLVEKANKEDNSFTENETIVNLITVNGENNKEIENEKFSKNKVKKSLIQKLRRRRRRQSSNSTDRSHSDDSDFNDCDVENELSENETNSDNNSDISYLTYTSSGDENDDDDHNEYHAGEEENCSVSNNSETTSDIVLSKGVSSDKTNGQNDLTHNGKPDNNGDKHEIKEFKEKAFQEFCDNDNFLILINMLFTWLMGEDDFLISCRTTAHTLFINLVKILNIVNRQIFPHTQKNFYNVSDQYHQSLFKLHEAMIKMKYVYKTVPLPEDYDMKFLDLSKEGLKNIKWESQKNTLTTFEANAVRLWKMIDFGVYIVKLDFGIIFNRRLKMYTFKKSKMLSKRNILPHKKYAKEPRIPYTKHTKNADNGATGSDAQSEGLMRNLGKLWLSARVQELESEVRAKHHQPNLPPYVVVDAEALSKYTYLVKRLVSSKRLIVLIPTIVVQLMDEMKKESIGARNAIRWMEYQLRSGSRFLRTQRVSETKSLPSSSFPKKMTRDVHNFSQIIEFCYYFIAQENDIQNDSVPQNDVENSEDFRRNNIKSKDLHNNIVVLLTGPRQMESSDLNECSFIGLANSVSVTVENIQSFCSKFLYIKGGKNR